MPLGSRETSKSPEWIAVPSLVDSAPKMLPLMPTDTGTRMNNPGIDLSLCCMASRTRPEIREVKAEMEFATKPCLIVARSVRQ
jgi:hypothetical protein